MCFGSYASVLSICKAPSVTQKELVGSILQCVNESYGNDIKADDTTVSALVRGKNNLSDYILLHLDSAVPYLLQRFKDVVVPLLDANRKANIVLAFKNILVEDTDIADKTEIELLNHMTKADFVNRDSISFTDLIAGLFLYVAKYTDNHNVRQYISGITESYIKSFDVRRDEITLIPSYDLQNGEEVNAIATDAHFLDLLAEVGGVCPKCCKRLSSDNCTPVLLDNGQELLLCIECGAIVNSSAKGMAEIVELKARLQNRSRTLDAVSATRLIEEVRTLIPLLNDLDPKVIPLRMTPLRVEHKVSNFLLQKRILGFIVDGMYDRVNECIEGLAAQNRLNVKRFSQSVRHMFEDAEAENQSESEIFNVLVKYVYVHTGQKYYEACELLIAYFVQRCEVFNEVTQQVNAV